MTQLSRAPSVRHATMVGRALIAALALSASSLWASAPGATTGADTPDVAKTVPAGGEPVLLAQAPDEGINKPPMRKAAFTREQADRGERLFDRACAECHGKDLKGGLNGGAPLTGSAFEQKYAEGAPASMLYIFLSSQMPPNSPGRYSEQDYADLMAFILKENGFRSGEPLPANIDTLYDLVVEK